MPAASTNPNRIAYCELHAHSAYSLLDGVATPAQLVDRAADLALPAVALTDHNALHGAAEFYSRAKQRGLQAILGAEITMDDGAHLTLLAKSQGGYSNLCRLVTAARMQPGTNAARLPWATLRQHSGGLICLTGCRLGPVASRVALGDLRAADRWLGWLIDTFGKRSVYVELQRHLGRNDVSISRRLAALATARGLPCVATGNVHYVDSGDGHLQSALVSLARRTPLPAAGRHVRPNHEFYLRSAAAMDALYPDLPEAVTNSLLVADQCGAVAPMADFEFPTFPVPGGLSAMDYLRQVLCTEGPHVKEKWREQLDAELALIARHDRADYVLTLWDIAAYCQRRGIFFQGVGTFANTITARALGLSHSGPATAYDNRQPLEAISCGAAPDFRFVLEPAGQPQVLDYIQTRLGFEHAEAIATFTCFDLPGAVRAAGFALDFNPAFVERLAQAAGTPDAATHSPTSLQSPPGRLSQLAASVNAGPSPLTATEIQAIVGLAGQLCGRPMGVQPRTDTLVLAQQPLTSLVPVETSDHNQGVAQLDEYSLQKRGIPLIQVQVSSLAQALSVTLELLFDLDRQVVDVRSLDYGDSAVFDTLCAARTLGVLRAEAGGDAELLPCIQARDFSDLVIESTLILQPSPLRGRMVQHYRHRRLGLQAANHNLPALRPALDETLGILIFEEQAVQILHDVAGFSSAECDAFRRALASPQAATDIEEQHSDFLAGTARNNLPPESAEQIWNMLAVFSSYAVSRARAHGLAAMLYWAAWLRLKYPAHYFCGQLTAAEPGTHAAHVISSEAVRVGVKLLPFDINRSRVQPVVERGAIRLGLRHIKGIDDAIAGRILAVRGNRPFRSLRDLIHRTRLERRVLEWLILAGALDSLGDRPHILWELAETFNIARRPHEELPAPAEPGGSLDALQPASHEMSVFAAAGNPTRMHLTKLRRDAFTRAGCLPWPRLQRVWNGRDVRVGGLVVTGPSRPSVGDGEVRLRLADPEGTVDVIVPAGLYAESREALRSAFLIVDGRLRRSGNALAVVARRIQTLAQ